MNRTLTMSRKSRKFTWKWLLRKLITSWHITARDLKKIRMTQFAKYKTSESKLSLNLVRLDEKVQFLTFLTFESNSDIISFEYINKFHIILVRFIYIGLYFKEVFIEFFCQQKSLVSLFWYLINCFVATSGLEYIPPSTFHPLKSIITGMYLTSTSLARKPDILR